MNKLIRKCVSYIYVITTVGLYSCQSDISDSINGDWVVEKIYYKDYDVKLCLRLNLITFQNNGQCKLPTSFDSCWEFTSKISLANWELIETDSIPLVLNIQSSNNAFARAYRVIFRVDETIDKLIMEVISDDLYMLCHRKLFNADVNRKKIAQLVEISHRDQDSWPKNR